MLREHPRFRRLHFNRVEPHGDRVHYLRYCDVLVLLSRLPAESWFRLRAVQFNDRSRGASCLGYVRAVERREIAICALPRRVSLSGACGRSKALGRQFGAKLGAQWPYLAVRRFLLYDVFLHELGHLQIIDSKAKTHRRKFAGETKAQQFATTWRKDLWSKRFDHPDPIHNKPSHDEIETVMASDDPGGL